jgi:hypothetical protein
MGTATALPGPAPAPAREPAADEMRRSLRSLSLEGSTRLAEGDDGVAGGSGEPDDTDDTDDSDGEADRSD